jgi:predicted CXXCH cytochrome family protein
VNKIFVAVAAALVLVGSAVAAESPASLVFKTKTGEITFDHKGHQERLKGDCKKCHEDGKGGKIAGWGKEKAHPLCQGCHKAEGKGPQPSKCKECHGNKK